MRASLTAALLIAGLAVVQDSTERASVMQAIAEDIKSRPWYATKDVPAEPWLDARPACFRSERPPCPTADSAASARFAATLAAKRVGADRSSRPDSLRVVYRLSQVRFVDGQAMATIYGEQILNSGRRFTQYDYVLARAGSRSWIVVDRKTQGG
jgi:hypothetical protein